MHRRARRLTVCAAVASLTSLASVHRAAAQNLVVDPGFESASVGQVAPPGWTHFVTAVNGGFDGAYGTLAGVAPFDGARQYTLGDNGTTGGIFQGIATIPGAFYTLTFYVALLDRLAPGDLINNSFVASWDGAAVYSLSNVSSPFSYQPQSFTVQATTGLTDLRFIARNDAAGWFIDDISVVAASVTPEPSLTLLMGTGLVGLGGFVRRRRIRTIR